MKNKLKNLIIFSLTILGIGIFNLAKADTTLVSTTAFDTNTGTLNLTWDSTTTGTNTATYFSTTISTSSLYMPFEYISGSWYTTANIINGNVNPQTYSGACAAGTQTWPSGTGLTTNSSSIWNGTSLVNANTLPSGTNIYLVQTSWTFQSCLDNTKTLVGYELLGTYENNTNPIEVSFRYPIDSTSINSNFTDFQIYAYNPNSVTAGASIEIYLSTKPDLSGYTTYTDSQTHILQPGTSTIYIRKNNLLQNNTTYYAKVRNLGTNSSSTISFNNGELTHTAWTGQTWPYTSSTLQSTSTEVNPFYVDCSGESFFSSCSLQKAIYATIGFLIVPPDFISDYMKNSLSNLNTVFPFSILYSFTGAIDGSINSTPVLDYADTSSTLPMGLSINILSQNGLRDILTTNTCNTTCAQEQVDTLFGIITSVIWFMTAIAVIILII